MASTLWKGHLSFGLVSIPVKLSRAARAEKIHMHHLQRDTGTRVRQVFVPATNEAAEVVAPPAPRAIHTTDRQIVAPLANDSKPERGIPRTDMVRGFEYEKDKYVEFEPGELEQIAPASSSAMEIVEFVRFVEVDPVYLESSYYVAPDNGAEKPYALLYEALRKTGYAAIAEFAMHRRDQTIILRPGRQGIIGHTLFYEDEVRRANEFSADAASAAPKEMELAIRLVNALAAPFEPGKFKDKYRERLHRAISKKVESEASGPIEKAARGKQVVDIMAALKESLAKAKKPAGSELKTIALDKKNRAGA